MWLGPSIPRARTVLPSGSWTPEDGDDRITLDFHARHRRRMRMTTDDGAAFLLDLAQTTQVRHGDGLLLDNGRRIRVVAAAEKLLEVRCACAHELARIAWHLGNRHLPVQVVDQVIRLRDDHVIAGMLRQMGADVVAVQKPFDPESGAYSGGHSHVHQHGDDEHGHSHG